MAARKIQLRFGLLQVACAYEGAVEKPKSLSSLCVGQVGKPAHDARPIRAPWVCDDCGEIKDRSSLKKGEKTGSTYTVVDQEAVAEAKEYGKAYKGTLEVVPHPAEQILANTEAGDSLNFVTPADAKEADHYRLLVQLVESHPELAFTGLYTPVSRTGLYVLRVKDGVLLMQERVREQSLKAAPSVGGEVNEALYAMLDGALGQFVTDYDPETYEDKYALALERMLAEGDTVSVDKAEAATPVRIDDDELIAKLAELKKAS